MNAVKIGDEAPDFTTLDQNGAQVSLGAYRGKQTVVLFFYPKDNSPICTKEACSFRDAYEDFVAEGAIVIGVSGDNVSSHQQFASAHRLPFLLLSDSDGALRRLFGVPKTLGVLPGRVTYVIDQGGVVRHMFQSQLSSDRHVQEALQVVRQIT